MGSLGSDTELPRPWIRTPLVRSAALSRAAEPSGSFKSRGVGALLLSSIAAHGPSKPIHFYCSSGGNAGLACAHAAYSLRRPCTIVVPKSTSQMMIAKIKLLEAEVVQVGEHWSEADGHLRNVLLKADPNGVYVPPFDHPDIVSLAVFIACSGLFPDVLLLFVVLFGSLITSEVKISSITGNALTQVYKTNTNPTIQWRGNSTMIPEILEQLQDHRTGNPSFTGSLDAIVCSVGGGGLLCGIMQGLEEASLLSSPCPPQILALETTGASSLALSLTANQLSTLPAITSIATSLGATTVAKRAYEYATQYREHVHSIVLDDAEAVRGMLWMADEERILVEAACGVSVVVGFNGGVGDVLKKVEGGEKGIEGKNVVIVVCGGSNVTLGVLAEYRERFGV
ncbi:L-serine dehydratase protein [Rutstroemia sp. NJR-2017a BBW]|nr:L-serine dehydratase protein [Rutstroemia sp. NJR-2017a BBW]